ncbi:DNA translocase FtsK [Citrobacter freundii]|uniref:DNA translocase FtsK n=1 Tax=Citrobacter freundii TaxID=546 RepID=UPI002A367233|nr:DNA translocase FtsK [Citrobacter freundii]
MEYLGGEVMKQSFAESENEGEREGDWQDPLFVDAARFVLDTARPTISAIQRQFRIGYNRAARLIEAMEAKGLLSAPKHDGTRSIIAGAEVIC